VGWVNVLVKAYASYLALRQRIVDAGLDVNHFDLGRDGGWGWMMVVEIGWDGDGDGHGNGWG